MKKGKVFLALLVVIQLLVFPVPVRSQEVEADSSAKKAIIKMEFTEVDSVKTINVTAHTLENGKEIPITGESISVYVPRMFSNFMIAELTLDDSGSASTEFPNDLPGGKEGNLTIAAGFINNATYGNASASEVKHWGMPTDYLPTSHRALWTSRAPNWMIITLSILLAGVWGHYFFAVISLIRIRLHAKKEKAKAEYRD
jgi:hypothetical protein